MFEIDLLARLSGIISLIAEGAVADAAAEIDRLIPTLEGQANIDPESHRQHLSGLFAARDEIRAYRPHPAAAELRRTCEPLWKRVLADASREISPPAPLPRAPGSGGSLAGRPPAPNTDEPAEVADAGQKAHEFRVVPRGPMYQSMERAAKTLRTRVETVNGLISLGELVAERREPSGEWFVTRDSIAAYQTRLFTKTAAEKRKRPRHEKG